MISYAGLPRVDVSAAQFFGADNLAGCRFHQWRAAENIVPWFLTIIVSSDMAGT